MPIAVSDRCCFGCCHVKTGTWILAIVQIVFAVLNFIKSIKEFVDQKGSAASMSEAIIGVLVSGVWLLFIILLIVALLKNRPSLILPHWICSIAVMVWLAISVVLLAVGGGSTMWFIIQNVIILLILLYMLYVEWCCYKWMSGEITV